MISRLVLRRGFSTNLTRLPSNARSSRLFRWLELYEEFVGLKEVKHAQSAVNNAEKRFITSQTQRRTYADDLLRTQVALSDLRVEMEKFSRSDDKYLELFQKEHQLIKKEKVIHHQLQQHEDEERELFASFQLALRESQEKEKMRIERTKYWSVIGSILGALMGILGATLSNRYRLQEFHRLNEQSQQVIERLIEEQERTMNDLKRDLQLSLTIQNSSKEIPPTPTDNEHLISRLTRVIVSTSFLSLFVSWWIHR